MIDLGKVINRKDIPENQNPNRIVDIVEKTLDFNKQQKGKGRASDVATRFKILAIKQMSYRLPIAIAEIKAGNTSENLLNEITQIIYSLYWEKEVTKKVYNNLMNSIEL